MVGRRKSREFHLRDALGEGIRYLERIRSMVSCFIAPAPIARRIMARHGVSADRITDLVYSLPADKLVPRPRPKGMPAIDRPLRVGFAGRVIQEKGVQVLVNAFRALPQTAPCELRILGRGANLKNLYTICPKDRDLADLVQTGRIQLFENLDEDAMCAEMAQLDLAVVPSISYECTPLALLELLAQGVPCIVSDSEGLKHVVSDGANGRLFRAGDALALARALEQVLAQPAVLERWRQHLYRPASDAHYAENLSALYRKLTGL